MDKSLELKNMLDQLEKKLRGLPALSVIKIIDQIIFDGVNSAYIPHLQIRKAMSLRHAGKVVEAADLLSGECRQHEEEEGLHYYAGEYYLESKNYFEAIHHLTRVLTISSETGKIWYQDAAYTLRAYGYAKTGKKILSRQDLKSISDDGSMGWIDVDPPVSKASIEMMLEN